MIPDLDGLRMVPELLTRHSSHPVLWFSQYHHALHNLLFGLVVALLAFALSSRKWLRAAFALGAFHLHLLEDLGRSAAEVSQAVNGWFLTLCMGVGIFGLLLIAVFRDIDRISTVLQGLGFGALPGIGLFRLDLLNTYGDADHLGGFICGLGCFGLEWAMLKNE